MIHVAIFVNLFFFSMDRAYRLKVPTEPKVKVKPKAKERHMCTCLMHGASRVGKLASYRPSQTQTHATQAQAQQVDRPTGRTLSLLISWSLPNSSPPHMRNFTVLNKYLEISKFLRYLTLRGTKFYTIKYGTFVYILRIVKLFFSSSTAVAVASSSSCAAWITSSDRSLRSKSSFLGGLEVASAISMASCLASLLAAVIGTGGGYSC